MYEEKLKGIIKVPSKAIEIWYCLDDTGCECPFVVEPNPKISEFISLRQSIEFLDVLGNFFVGFLLTVETNQTIKVMSD